MLDGVAGEGAARVLPLQLCDALQDQEHQFQHHRHRKQQYYVSHVLLIRKLAVWSVALDWIHVTPRGAAAAAAAAAAAEDVITDPRALNRQLKGAHHQMARRYRHSSSASQLYHPIPYRLHWQCRRHEQLLPPC
jgi:hypothetical protein